MKVIHVLAGASFAMLLGPVTSLAGSYPQNHHNFFIGFNAGAGKADVRFTGGGEHLRQSGGAANVRIGGAVINNVLLSAELTGWLWKEDGHPIGIANALFALTWFPAGGFFVRAGMGWGDTHFLETAPTGHVTASKDEVGTSFGFATGYEWRLTKKFALGPQVEYTWVNIGGEFVDKASYASTTLGFNWYW
jgi:hypothetical protein